MSKIVDFPFSDGEPNEPTYYQYNIAVLTADGGTELITCEGYLIATPAFIGICKGQFHKSEFMFVAPIDQVRYAKSNGPVQFTGKLSS